MNVTLNCEQVNWPLEEPAPESVAGSRGARTEAPGDGEGARAETKRTTTDQEGTPNRSA